MMAVTILESGLASCVTEPRCRHNLEGYGLSEPYRFDRCQDEKGRYCRVYPERTHLTYPCDQAWGHSHFNIWSTLAMMSLLNFSHCSNVGGNSQGKMTSSRSSMSTLNQ